jgi:hypothetical protein
MRDKVLCRGWVELKSAKVEEEFPFFWEGDLLAAFQFPTFLSGSVLVSIQGGVKMGIDEFLRFFDRSVTWKGQKTQTLERSNQGLDIIRVAGPLFKGTVVDFDDLRSHSGGGNYANSFAVN